jgi:tetratricopeptide (TPR) repeat protein
VEVYERLCELSVALGDEQGFARYARKSAERYPYDRQYYNMGIALFGIDDWAGVVTSQKEAIDKFPRSQYVGSFYRQLGRAYEQQKRDQTAERTFTAGIQVVDDRIADLKRPGSDAKSAEKIRRLTDDKIAMLLSLKKLHQTYKASEKLEQVERQLREAGYPR